jgi:hypothetical protein
MESEIRKKVEQQEVVGDLFLSEMWKMVEEGQIARMSGNALKSELILKIQSYSTDIPLMHGQVSDLFLKLCDLMVEGEIGKMHPDTLKVYLILLLLNFGSTEYEKELDPLMLQKYAGITDSESLRNALSQLKEEGYMNQLENQSNGRGSKKKKQQLFEIEMPAT